MDRRSLLLVAYHFPPFGGSGVQRALKLAKYLPQYGWHVHVLTAGHSHYSATDESFLDELGEFVTIHRVRGHEPGGLAATVGDQISRWRKGSRQRGAPTITSVPGQTAPSSRPTLEQRIFWRLDRWATALRLPEIETLWTGPALRAAMRIIQDHAVDAVLTTSPPHAVHRIGAAIRRRVCLPWIADLRDPVLDNFTFDAATAGRREIRWRSNTERLAVEEADRIVVTCPELSTKLSDRYGPITANKLVYIPNGYDPADAPTMPPRDAAADHHVSSSKSAAPPEDSTRDYVLGYAGSFYGAQSIEPLRQAVRRLGARRPNLADRLRIEIVGHVSRAQRESFTAADEHFFDFKGGVVHSRAIEAMFNADALFLMTPLNEGGRYCIPAKVFEYLAFGRHIVALVHAGTELERILRNAGNTTVIEHGETAVESLALALASRIEASNFGSPAAERSPRFLASYQRSSQAERFSELFDLCRSATKPGSAEFESRLPIATARQSLVSTGGRA